MAQFSDEADGNPNLNDPENLDQVAQRVDAAQGFQIDEPLPGEQDDDDGYETALSGAAPGETEEEADLLDNRDLSSGIGQGSPAGREGGETLAGVDEPALGDGERALAAPADGEQG